MPAVTTTLSVPFEDRSAAKVAVDLVLLTIKDGTLRVLMTQQTNEPFKDKFILPSMFADQDRLPETTARKVLENCVGDLSVRLEPFAPFGSHGRDPRGWVVSMPFLGVVPVYRLVSGQFNWQGSHLIEIADSPLGGSLALWADRNSDPHWLDELYAEEERQVEAALDHAGIITAAVGHLRSRLDSTMTAFQLLPPMFTLLELQKVHEAILGRPLHKAYFRKRILGRVFPTGQHLVGTGQFQHGPNRPAEYYELRQPFVATER